LTVAFTGWLESGLLREVYSLTDPFKFYHFFVAPCLSRGVKKTALYITSIRARIKRELVPPLHKSGDDQQDKNQRKKRMREWREHTTIFQKKAPCLPVVSDSVTRDMVWPLGSIPVRLREEELKHTG
jgi:hypothetical protein